MTVYRGLDSRVVDSLKKGDEFQDNGFLSTSIAKRIGRTFAYGNAIGKQVPTICQITVPKGTPCMSTRRPKLNASSELEVLFPCGTVCHVDRIRWDGDIRVIEMTMQRDRNVTN